MNTRKCRGVNRVNVHHILALKQGVLLGVNAFAFVEVLAAFKTRPNTGFIDAVRSPLRDSVVASGQHMIMLIDNHAAHSPSDTC